MFTHTAPPNDIQLVPFFEEVGPWLRFAERRLRPSEFERTSEILAHAVEHLISQRLQGLHSAGETNAGAIAILCHAGRELAEEERRQPARRAIAAWLRGAALARAQRR